MPSIGDIVIYTDEFDSDESQHPNIAPALVTKVHPNGNADLAVFVENGSFYKLAVAQGVVGERLTWRFRDKA